MQKIKILIAIYSLGNGGGEKSLVNMLNSLDPNLYDIYLQMFENEGINLQFVPSWVHILPALFPDGMLSSKQQMLIFLRKGKLNLAVKKGISLIESKKKNSREKTLIAWKNLKPLCAPNNSEYDLVISGMHGLSTYYAFDCVKAKRKIAWVHTDYSKIPRVEEDIDYFKQADAVVTVSQHCHDTLQAAFPELNNIIILQNINCPQMIKRMSEEKSKDECFGGDTKYYIVSIGRLIPLKGFDMAIEAAAELKQAGLCFKWYFIGEGEEKETLINQAEQAGLSSNIIFTGAMSNPYPYIKNADLLVQSSRYEGKSMVLDEAKILGTPIVATAYDSVKDQIEDGVNGVVVPISSNGIADGIKRMLLDSDLRKNIVELLQKADNAQNELINQYNNLFTGRRKV